MGGERGRGGAFFTTTKKNATVLIQVKKGKLCLCFYLTLLWYESECILLSIFLFKQHFSFTTQEIISDDDDDEEFNIPLSSSVKKTKTTQ